MSLALNHIATLRALQLLYRHWPLALTPHATREYWRLYRRFATTFFTAGWPWQECCFSLLKKTITHAYNAVALYREKYRAAGITPEDIHSLADVSLLPYVTRAEMLDAFPHRAMAFSVPVRRWIPDRTSGSTGMALCLFRDRDGQPVVQATRRLFQDLAGVPPFAKFLSVWGAAPQEEVARVDRVVRPRSKRPHNRYQLRLRLRDVPPCDSASVARSIRQLNPVMIAGTASCLLDIGEIQQETPYPLCPRLRAIVCTGDTITADDEQRLEHIFGRRARVANRYGSHEFTGNIAQSCPLSREVLHWNPEHYYVELTGDGGRPVGEGQIGNVLVTDLHNYVMPFIRYSLGDVAAARSSVCGHGWPTIGRVGGRSAAVFVAPTGKRVTEEVVQNGVEKADLGGELREYQLVISGLFMRLAEEAS